MRKLSRRSARRYPVLLATSLLLFISAIPGIAATDTLRTYEPGGHYGVYTDGSILKCVQRMRLPAGARMTSVSVMLDGPASEHACDVVVYGHEGGLIAPRLERAAARARLIKEHSGIETITVPLDYVHEGGQCFVSIEGRADGIRLVTDMVERMAPCTEASGQRRMEQLVQTGNDTWSTAPYGFVMDVAVDMPDITERGFVRDTMLDDAHDKRRNDIRYLSVGDVNGDGRLDISAAGLLYLNDQHGMTPVDIGLQDTSAIPYVFFVDADGDGRMDVAAMNGAGDSRLLFYSMRGTTRGTTLVQIGSADLTTRLVPMSMSVGDVDNDGMEDILLGGVSEGAATLLILRRTASGTWQATPWATNLLTTDAPTTMIADVDRDGRLDVLLRTGTQDHIVRMVSEDQSWSMALGGAASRRNDPIGAWIGWDHERQAAILRLPSPVPWKGAGEESHDVRMTQYGRASIAVDDGDAERPRYEERLSSVLYADLDNDGIEEQLRCSRGTCRYLTVYRKTGGTWEDVTSAWNLEGLDDCDDAIVTDLDGDGRRDILVDRRGSVQVYYNRMNIMPGRTVRLSAAPQPMAGTSVDVSGRARMTYVSGRGRLIQDPPVLTLPPARSATDTMTVYWPGSAAQKERVLIADQRQLRRGASGVAASYDEAVQIRMAESGTLAITASETLENATLTVLDLVGERVMTHPLGTVSAGAHTLTIHELDKTKRLITGTYVVRLQWEHGDAVSVLRIIR